MAHTTRLWPRRQSPARELQKKLRADGAKTAEVRAQGEGSGVQLRIDLDVKDAGVLLE